MLSQDEMERKLDALSAQNTALQRRISDLEEGTAGHVGIDYGAAQQLSPHPSQQIENAEFGGGKFQLNKTGIQILANDSALNPAAVFFLPEFVPSVPYTGTQPVPNSTQWSGITGNADNSDNHIELLSVNTSVTDRQAIVQAYAEGSNSFAFIGSRYTTGVYVKCTAYSFSSGESGVFIENGQLVLYRITSDPSVLRDGSVWYRTDLFRPRIRSNGITGNLGMEIQSAAADVIATGGTITTAGVSAARVAPTGAVTGVILAVGTTGGQMCQIVNESAAGNTVTFAVAATSNVANGATSVIAGLNARSFVWNSVTALWYPCI